jgi:chromate reductase
MNPRKKILAISGSTRKASSNLNLIHAVAALSAAAFDLQLFEGLSDIPHFNPDLLPDKVPGQVLYFYKQLKEADGILICTPEYAIGVPGTLKNAIDWTVSAMGFSQKPVALITASTSGAIAHQSLLGTLLIIESRITKDTQLQISAIKTKVSTDNKIIQEATLQDVKRLIDGLADIIADKPGLDYLPAPSLI